MQPVGLIIGKGFTKAWTNDRGTRFRSLAARWSGNEYDSALGAAPTPVRLDGRGDWLVGDEALTFARHRLIAVTDKQRYGEPAFLALARQALAEVLVQHQGYGLRIRTGMPTAWYRDQHLRTALAQALQAAGAPWGDVQVRVAPESAGVYYAYLFAGGRFDRSRMQDYVGIVDWGYGDVNVALFHNGRNVAGDSVEIGMSDALRTIQRQIAADPALRLDLTLPEVDAAVRSGRVFADGRDRPLPAASQQVLADALAPVLALARAQWPEGGRRVRAVVLGGGGVVPFGPALWAAFPQVVVPGADLLPAQQQVRAALNAQGLGTDAPPDLVQAALAGPLRSPAAALQQAIAQADPQIAPARGFAAFAELELLQAQRAEV